MHRLVRSAVLVGGVILFTASSALAAEPARPVHDRPDRAIAKCRMVLARWAQAQSDRDPPPIVTRCRHFLASQR